MKEFPRYGKRGREIIQRSTTRPGVGALTVVAGFAATIPFLNSSQVSTENELDSREVGFMDVKIRIVLVLISLKCFKSPFQMSAMMEGDVAKPKTVQKKDETIVEVLFIYSICCSYPSVFSVE